MQAVQPFGVVAQHAIAQSLPLLPGAFMLAALAVYFPSAPVQLRLLRDGDWPGIATLAIGLTSLQTLLEEGNKDDWFDSTFIVRLIVVAMVTFALFFWIELTTHKPPLNLSLLVRRIFGLDSLANVILEIADVTLLLELGLSAPDLHAAVRFYLYRSSGASSLIRLRL